MGLFSLFKKPSSTPTRPEPPSADESARLAADSEMARQQTQALQRDIARATAMKIDAIESAMAFDIFNTPEPAWGSRAPRPAPTRTDDGPGTLPLLDQHTTQLLHDEDLPPSAVAAQSAPVVEEIAILYANGQSAVAQQMLVESLPESGAQDRTVWWMLFDLYQLTDAQEQFDSLSIDYASKFETSPPAWVARSPAAAATTSYSGVTPTEAFAGILNAGIAPQLARLHQLAIDNPMLRLEFNRVTGIEADGCALLLQALQALQARQCELIVVAAGELAEQLRASIAVGRRDDTSAPWLLLLELLQLLNREKDFEECSMDYCVTFEVSPSFVAPRKIATSARQHVSTSPDRYMLPPVMEGSMTDLLEAIDAYAVQHPTLVFDCSRLARLEFGAANQLLVRLQSLAQGGRKIEFRDLNHLVAALLRLLGYSDLAKIYAHKY